MSKELESRIENLEKRIKYLEELVNDLSIQIDNPIRNQEFNKDIPKRRKNKKPKTK